MSHFTWDPSLATGNEQIDAQHQTLFELANRLHGATTGETADPEAVQDAVYGLADYVLEHFEAEEALMLRLGYPGAGSHRGLHEVLAADTMRLVAAHFNGDPHAAARIGPFVAKWLREHIAKEDQRFARHVRSASE